MKLLGLNVPVYVQYGRWVSDIVVHGSFGTSLRSSQPITPDDSAAYPLTFELGPDGANHRLIDFHPHRRLFRHPPGHHHRLYPAQSFHHPYLGPQLLAGHQ